MTKLLEAIIQAVYAALEAGLDPTEIEDVVQMAIHEFMEHRSLENDSE